MRSSMGRDDPDEGAYTADEFRAMGAEFVPPDDHEAFDREMAAALDAHDDELRAREGPDAVTSDRLLRMAALTAESDPGFVGAAFAAFRDRRGLARADLASWLGVDVDQLAALAVSPRPDPRSAAFADQVRVLAKQYGAEAGRLYEVLTEE